MRVRVSGQDQTGGARDRLGGQTGERRRDGSTEGSGDSERASEKNMWNRCREGRTGCWPSVRQNGQCPFAPSSCGTFFDPASNGTRFSPVALQISTQVTPVAAAITCETTGATHANTIAYNASHATRWRNQARIIGKASLASRERGESRGACGRDMTRRSTFRGDLTAFYLRAHDRASYGLEGWCLSLKLRHYPWKQINRRETGVGRLDAVMERDSRLLYRVRNRAARGAAGCCRSASG